MSQNGVGTCGNGIGWSWQIIGSNGQPSSIRMGCTTTMSTVCVCVRKKCDANVCVTVHELMECWFGEWNGWKVVSCCQRRWSWVKGVDWRETCAHSCKNCPGGGLGDPYCQRKLAGRVRQCWNPISPVFEVDVLTCQHDNCDILSHLSFKFLDPVQVY